MLHARYQPRVLLLAVLSLQVACTHHRLSQQQRTAAYLVALRIVSRDVRGDPPGGPLALDTRLLPSPGSPDTVLDAGTARVLAGSLALLPMHAAYRGLVASVSGLRRLHGGDVALTAAVHGRAAPGDNTVILGPPYQAEFELAPADSTWRVVRKKRF